MGSLRLEASESSKESGQVSRGSGSSGKVVGVTL